MQDKKNTVFIVLWLFAVILLLCVFICTVAYAASGSVPENSDNDTINANNDTINTDKGVFNTDCDAFYANNDINEADNECVFYLSAFVPIEQKEESPCRMQLTEEERYMLARIVMAEAEVEDLEGKALVACVIMNRIEYEPEFENTIEGVIFERGQFSPVRPGCRYWKVEPNEDCYKAVDMVISGWDESHGALYFEGCKSADNWHSRNLKYLFQHGTHRFYKYR